MNPAQSITTVAKEDQDHVQSMAGQLQAAGHPVQPADITPASADTPVPNTPELKEVGAEVIGEDISHIVGTTVGDLTYGKTRIRETKSNRFLSMLKNKLLRKKKPDEEVIEK